MAGLSAGERRVGHDILLAARRRDVFGPAVMDRRRIVFRQERGEPALPADAAAGALGELGAAAASASGRSSSSTKVAAVTAAALSHIGSMQAGMPPIA
jgi:hypothetical protein